MSGEKVSIFAKMVNIFKDNIKNIKDERRQRSDLKYNYTDIILGAFSMLYFQNPSWLSFQQKMQDNNGGNNAASMFDINIPSQNYSKKLLDKLIDPEITLQDSVKFYKDGMKQLQEAQKLLDEAKVEFEKLDT